MRIRAFFVVLLLLVFSISASSVGLASGSGGEEPVSTWEGLAGPAAELGTLQANNNTTAPPSFPELVPIIIFVLAGVGIAIVIVAVGLWTAGRRKRGNGEGGGKREDGEAEVKEENDEWGAKW
ncbi:MAG: hypothetical protein ACE5LS_06520 [Thermoplasmata archaeon]